MTASASQSTSSSSNIHASFRIPLLVLLGYVLIAVLYTWPLALHLGDSVPGVVTTSLKTSTVDQDQVLWSLWWTDKSLTSLHNPFVTDRLYYPYQSPIFGNPSLSLYLYDLQILHTAVALPIVKLAGLVAGFNFVVFLSFVLAAWGAYLLAKDRGISGGGAIFTGLVYGFGPYHLTQLFAQVPRIALESVPFFALFFLRAIEGRGKWSWLWAGLALAATNYLDWYYALHSGVLAVLLLLYAAVTALRHNWADIGARVSRPLLRVTASFAVWLALMLPLLIPVINEVRQASTRNAGSAAFNSIFPTPATLVAGSTDLLDFVQAQRDTQGVWQQSPFVGYTALLLAIFGVITRWRSKRGEIGRWLWVTIAAVVFALGPTLQIAGNNTGLPLPYVIFSQLPLLNTFQYPWRFANLAVLGLGLLAGFGVSSLSQRLSFNRETEKWITRSGGIIITALALVLATLEYIVLPLPLYQPTVPTVFADIAKQPGDAAVLELPITNHQTSDHRRLLYQTVHGKPIVGGYLPRPRPDPYRDPSSPFAALIELQPSRDIITNNAAGLAALMRFYNFSHLVIYPSTMNADWQDSWLADALPSLTRVYSGSDTIAYTPPPSDNQPHIYLGYDWYAPEAQGSEVKRWVKGSVGHLSVLAPQAGDYTVSFSAVSFARSQQVQFVVDGGDPIPMQVGSSFGPFAIKLKLAAGLHSIALQAESAVSPKQLQMSDDQRQLSIALMNVGVKLWQ